MRIAVVATDAGPLPVRVEGEQLIPFEPDLETLGALGLRHAEIADPTSRAEAELSEPRLLSPVRPGQIVAIGLNYLDHIQEAGLDRPAAPLVFAKLPSSVAGPGEPIRIRRAITERVDWEVELAVVIGTDTRDVPAPEALGHVFGYTVGNDVSARDVQFGDGQWVRGKSLDTFCPVGPVVVTADEIGDPQSLALSTTVNGERVQDSSTSEMLFGVAELIAYCSRSFTLRRGDLLLTGTPWGCGEFMDPPRSLQHGDSVSVSIEQVGTLTNPVIVEP